MEDKEEDVWMAPIAKPEGSGSRLVLVINELEGGSLVVNL